MRTLNPRTLAKKAAEAAADKKAINVAVMDIRHATDTADYIVIAGADSSTQVRAVYEGVVTALKESGVFPIHQDGRGNDHWVAIDYGDFLVHILKPEARELYRLEYLWENAKIVDWGNIEEEPQHAKAKKGKMKK